MNPFMMAVIAMQMKEKEKAAMVKKMTWQPKTRVVEKKNSKNGELDGCSICLEELSAGHEVYDLPCSHLYHKKCIHVWLQKHRTCPLCRRPL